MLNHLDLLKHQLLATTMVKMDILSHNAKSKEKIKEKKEEIRDIIKTIIRDITLTIINEKELQDPLIDHRIINGSREIDLKVVKELQTIIKIGIEIIEIEVDYETHIRLIEKVNTNEPPHHTQEMLTIWTMMKITNKKHK